MFYLSEYLESHRDEYYQRLRNISEEQDWNGWIAFFLQAITHQAKENGMRVHAIMGLYENMKNEIYEITHSQYSLHLLDAIFYQPIFKTLDCAARLKQGHNVYEKTTLSLLRQLKEYDVLMELQSGSGRRAATLCFPELINLAEGKALL